MILIIPAGWSLWLTPNAPPESLLLGLILSGSLFISGAGCIANDLWDRKIDEKVRRTNQRPLAKGTIRVPTAFALLFVMLVLSLSVVLHLPNNSRYLCLFLSFCALAPILIYPSAKRWFKYPQALLAICWGFAVLIPWAASEGSLGGGVPLFACWIATVVWTFGFDTVYAMADKTDDAKLGLNSSVLSLGKQSIKVVSICYAISSSCLAVGAFFAGINWYFWPIWLIAALGMQREVAILKGPDPALANISRHFQNQVWLGSLFWLGLVLGQINP